MSLDTEKTSYQRGRWAEQTALDYLLSKKLKLLDRNFRSTFGEIDLIMQDRDLILFIEVRYRSNNRFHTALESINQKKCERIILTSQSYLTHHRNISQHNCRFDVIAMTGAQNQPLIEWIKNAFQA